MIETPVNDHGCLKQITEVVRSRVDDSDEVLHGIAEKFDATDELAGWIQSLPQRDDEGIPGDGPKARACRPPQRLRVPAPDPNCVERAALYLGVAEIIDPGPTRQLITVNTPAGRHTYPIEDTQSVVLDPKQTRNALDGGRFRLDRRPLEVTSREAVDWVATIAQEPAAARGQLHRLRNAQAAMRAVMSGGSVSPQAVSDIAYTVDEADREALHFGPRGRELHRQTAGKLANAMITQRRRNAGANLKLDNFVSLANAGGPFGGIVSQLSKLGLGDRVLGELEKVLGKDGLKKGLTLGGLAIGGPIGGSVGALAGEVLVRNAADERNAGGLGLKTPGVIRDEIHTTDSEIRALGKDIWVTFRDPFEAQQRLAEARFEKERGYKPGMGGKDSDTARDFAQVYGWMHPVPTAVDIENKSYQGLFAYQWGEFTREWTNFLAEHENWWDLMWRGSYDKAIEFRERTVTWREKFQQLGGKPTSPSPVIPLESDVPWKPILLVAGLGAAALLLPGVLRAFGS